MARPSFLKSRILWPLQGGLVRILFWLVKLLPFSWSSALGGRIGRTLGPVLGVSRIAKDNLHRAFPEKTETEIQHILSEMWDNLGRVVFEFPHLAGLNIYDHPERFEVLNTHVLDEVKKADKGAIFFSAHMANWEISPISAARHDPPLPIHLVYREPENPYMRSLFAKRKPTPECGLIPKGAKGARDVMAVLKNKGYVAMLLDQKMNDGIEVPFFNRPAMTAPAIVQFALKYNCPVVPTQIERTGGATFRLTFYEPLYFEAGSDRKADQLRIMTELNAIIEGWIRKNPAQWLWVHRRWPKD